MIRKSRAWALALVSALAIAAAASPAAAAPAKPDAAGELELDRVVAVVNREVILESELERRVAHATTSRDASDPQRAMLWAMIDERLLAQLAEDRRLNVTDQDVDAAIAEIQRQNGLDEEQLLKELAKQGYGLEDYRGSVKRQLLAMRIINLIVRPQIEVSDAEIEAAYRAQSGSGGDSLGDGSAVLIPPDVKQQLSQAIFARKLDLGRDRLAVQLRRQAHIDIRLEEPR